MFTSRSKQYALVIFFICVCIFFWTSVSVHLVNPIDLSSVACAVTYQSTALVLFIFIPHLWKVLYVNVCLLLLSIVFFTCLYSAAKITHAIPLSDSTSSVPFQFQNFHKLIVFEYQPVFLVPLCIRVKYDWQLCYLLDCKWLTFITFQPRMKPHVQCSWTGSTSSWSLQSASPIGYRHRASALIGCV